MATQTGNWIKMRVDLQSHPKVVRIASALNADRKGATKRDRMAVVGALHAVWSVFDAHSADGRLDGYSCETMDEEIGWPGFTAAMVAAEWLVETDDGLQAPEYEEHNGASAKRRAQETQRKRQERAECPHEPVTTVREMSASDADKKRSREEKSINTPLPPKGEGRFPEFWTSWPASPRKQDRKKCLEKWRRKGWDSIADTIIAHVVVCKASSQWLDGYDPAPLTYLNGERWNDGPPAARREAREPADIYGGGR